MPEGGSAHHLRRSILCRQEELSLLAKAYGEPLLPPDITLMEIKCNRRTAAVDDTYALREHLYRTSFSKYGTAYQTLIRPSRQRRTDRMLEALFQMSPWFRPGHRPPYHRFFTVPGLCAGTGTGNVLRLYVPHPLYQKLCGDTGASPGRSLRDHPDGQRKCRHRRRRGRHFQPGTIPLDSGTSREICMLFLAMGTGLITGMGYLGYAVLFTLILCAAFCLYNWSALGEDRNAAAYKVLSGIIPEGSGIIPVSLTIFLMAIPPVAQLVHVKTTSMGQPVSSDYQIRLLDAVKEKEMIDLMRCRMEIWRSLSPCRRV